jgi:hypothetical protein
MSLKLFYSKDSFDRFGDDLYELLLSYLSISDKIYFECLSKQWQRLVFIKQQKLIKNSINYFRIYDTIIVSQKVWNENKLPIIKCLTKKFKYIIDLEISFIINNQILEIFAKNCKFLTKVKFYGRDIRGFCETFGQKCGKNWNSLTLKIFLKKKWYHF